MSISATAPPRALYRIQLDRNFGFASLQSQVPYLHNLGISHLYLSPVFLARPGSTHGYDVLDHSRINPELGGEDGFASLVRECRACGMGVVLDLVPNHMAVLTPENAWWMDVLEHGPASGYADYFDIDWASGRSTMRNRILVPALEEPLGNLIERGDIRIEFDREMGRFAVRCGGTAYPVGAHTVPLLFELNSAAGIPSRLKGLFDQCSGSEELAGQLSRLCAQQTQVARYIEQAIAGINDAGDGRAAAAKASFLGAQSYRLAFWRVAGEEINYRRFFDVNDLAALRAEEPRVFDATHGLIRRLWKAGHVDGLRIDHADGLHDPAAYLHRLREFVGRRRGQSPWVVVEKILAPGESLPSSWEVEGTTGYDFAALVTGWLMNAEGSARLDKIYRRYVGPGPTYAEHAYQGRALVMRTSLAAEVSRLAVRLDRLAQLHWSTSDFTRFDLRNAIVEVIAGFPVYRTYVHASAITEEDVRHIHLAVAKARGRKQCSLRALEFLETVLLGQAQGGQRCRAAAMEFTMKFQQVCASVMAKGVEDTAYFRYPCLLAMNEVGADPTCRGIHTETLHRANEARHRSCPDSLLATSTHDTKFGEDARFRLSALTTSPDEWSSCLGRWRRLKSRRRGASSIGAGMEYLLLGALLAIHPEGGAHDFNDDLRARMEAYAVKAAREAKELTSWLEPDEQYEKALRAYVALLLPANGAAGFDRYFSLVLERVARLGMLNSLSAMVLKYTSPGVPDTYQGNELPSLVLVDPDNRRTPDFARHAGLLAGIEQSIACACLGETATRLLSHWRDGRLKLFVVARLLALRRRQGELFARGSYIPLEVRGMNALHICAFVRADPACAVLVVASRWHGNLIGQPGSVPTLSQRWADTRVVLPDDLAGLVGVDAFSGKVVQPVATDRASQELGAGELLDVLPVSVVLFRRDGADPLSL